MKINLSQTNFIQVEPKHYYNNYDEKKRFISYWHQINEIKLLNPVEILEIGIGNGFVSEYLIKNAYKIQTLDMDIRLNPTFVGIAQSIPIKDKSFDLVAAFEVLEHIPYDEVPIALSEIYRVSKRYAVISIPDFHRRIRFFIDIPKVFTYKKILTLPRLRNPEHIFDGEHYWELGRNGYNLDKFLELINKTGFNLIKTYRIYENPYHRIFVLEI